MEPVAVRHEISQTGLMTVIDAPLTRIDQELAQIALGATLSVKDYLREAARSAPEFQIKRDIHDPVTFYDKNTEAMLRDYLVHAIPGSRFLGEEMGEEPVGEPAAAEDGVRGLGDRVRWIVDPIDGTANFAAGLVYFCTSIAAELDGKVVAGAITVPVVGESFVADAQRAWHIAPDGTETDMTADGPATENTALIISYYPGLSAFRNDPQQAGNQYEALLAAYSTVRRTGAGALDLAHVAAGWTGAVLGAGFGPWDVAAGIHMVRVAGGRVLSLPLGTDLPDGLRPAVVAEGRNLDAQTARRILVEIDALKSPTAGQ